MQLTVFKSLLSFFGFDLLSLKCSDPFQLRNTGKTFKNLCTGCRCPGAGRRHLQGGLFEERPGLPRVGHSRFQTAPTDPPQGLAEPHSHDGSFPHDGESLGKDEQNTARRRGDKCEKQSWEYWGMEEGEEVVQLPEQEAPTPPEETVVELVSTLHPRRISH